MALRAAFYLQGLYDSGVLLGDALCHARMHADAPCAPQSDFFSVQDTEMCKMWDASVSLKGAVMVVICPAAFNPREVGTVCSP